MTNNLCPESFGVNHGQDIPVRRGTWLQGSRLTYRHIILFIYCWSKELTSISFCESELYMAKETVIDYNNYLHEVCANTLITNPVILGGPNTTVEIDESMFTWRKMKLVVSYHSNGYLVKFVVRWANALCIECQTEQRQHSCHSAYQTFFRGQQYCLINGVHTTQLKLCRA